MEPTPREIESVEYIKKHKIHELFDNMISELVFNRPDNPKEFMIQYLEKLSFCRAQNAACPNLFDESNVRSLLGMIDPTGKGFISAEQYIEAMTVMGVKEYQKPGNANSGEVFVKEAKAGLAKAAATFNS